MAEYFMGQELIQAELPTNSPKPAETPPEGIIMTDSRPDGSSRRYIYIAMAGEAPEEITISESAGRTQPRVSGVASPVYDEPALGYPAYDEPALGDADVPEGIDLPTNAVLPENAVFSGIPSSCVEGRKPVMPCEGPKVPAPAPVPAPVQTIQMAGMRPQESPAIRMSGAVPTSAALAPTPGQAIRMAGMRPQEAPVIHEPRQPIRASGVMPPPAAPVATMSILKAAPPAPVMVQPAQGPVPGGQVYVPPIQGPVQESRHEMSGNIKLSNSIETVRPVVATPFVEAAPLADRQITMMGQSRSLPLTVQESRKSDAYPLANPINQKTPMTAGIGPIGGPTGFVQNQIPLRHLGQAAAPAPTAPPPAPVSPAPSKCPGAVEMPDGRVIEPGDGISLQDLCELVPFLIETLTNLQAQGLAPGQKLSVVGGQPGMLAVPNQGAFGPAGGFRAGGPGGFVGGGGGGPGPAGAQGPMGVAGPPGPGNVVEPPVVKTDGDFTAGPGAFVPVPGTALVFPMQSSGVARFDLIATLGSTLGAVSTSQSAQIGLRIDGTDYPLTTRLLHTFVGGVGEFLIGQSFTFGLPLGAGSHTVEVLLRGLLPGEYGGAGLGIPATVAAVPTVPLILTVSHNL